MVLTLLSPTDRLYPLLIVLMLAVEVHTDANTGIILYRFSWGWVRLGPWTGVRSPQLGPSHPPAYLRLTPLSRSWWTLRAASPLAPSGLRPGQISLFLARIFSEKSVKKII